MSSSNRASLKNILSGAAESLERDLVHPDLTELADYQDRLLSDERSEQICSHLAVCRTCTQSLLTLYEPLESDDIDEAPAPIATAHFEARDNPSQKPKVPFFLAYQPAWAAAAALFLALLATGAWGVGQYKERIKLNQPRVAVAVADLFPVGEAIEKGAGEGSVVVRINDQTEQVLLFMHPGVALDFPEYSINIIHAETITWRSSRIPPPLEEGFVLTIPSSFLKKKVYSLELLGHRGKHQEQVTVFQFNLE